MILPSWQSFSNNCITILSIEQESNAFFYPMGHALQLKPCSNPQPTHDLQQSSRTVMDGSVTLNEDVVGGAKNRYSWGFCFAHGKCMGFSLSLSLSLSRTQHIHPTLARMHAERERVRGGEPWFWQRWWWTRRASLASPNSTCPWFALPHPHPSVSELSSFAFALLSLSVPLSLWALGRIQDLDVFSLSLGIGEHPGSWCLQDLNEVLNEVVCIVDVWEPQGVEKQQEAIRTIYSGVHIHVVCCRKDLVCTSLHLSWKQKNSWCGWGWWWWWYWKSIKYQKTDQLLACPPGIGCCSSVTKTWRFMQFCGDRGHFWSCEYDPLSLSLSLSLSLARSLCCTWRL